MPAYEAGISDAQLVIAERRIEDVASFHLKDIGFAVGS